MPTQTVSPITQALIDEAASYAELARYALEMLQAMQGEVAIVCGPISTGGVQDRDQNLVRFNEVIETLSDRGYTMFSQMPFERSVGRIKKERVARGHWPVNCYDWPLLHDLYGPIFTSGIIKTAFFMPNWQTSKGATWEREQLTRLDITIIDLDASLQPIAA